MGMPCVAGVHIWVLVAKLGTHLDGWVLLDRGFGCLIGRTLGIDGFVIPWFLGIKVLQNRDFPKQGF